MPTTRKNPTAGVKRGAVSFTEARDAAEHAKARRATSFEHDAASAIGSASWERYLGHFGGTKRRGARKSDSKTSSKRSGPKRGGPKRGAGKKR